MLREMTHLKKKIKKLKHRLFDEEEEEIVETPKHKEPEIVKRLTTSSEPEQKINLDEENPYVENNKGFNGFRQESPRPIFFRRADLLNYKRFGF
jgi:hypothetical protein